MHRGTERHPGRDRGADEPAVDVGSRLFQRDLDALRNRRRNLAAGVGDYRDELVAAPARHHLASPICAMAISANICKVRSPTA
jgi:hypothetical protein